MRPACSILPGGLILVLNRFNFELLGRHMMRMAREEWQAQERASDSWSFGSAHGVSRGGPRRSRRPRQRRARGDRGGARAHSGGGELRRLAGGGGGSGRAGAAGGIRPAGDG